MDTNRSDEQILAELERDLAGGPVREYRVGFFWRVVEALAAAAYHTQYLDGAFFDSVRDRS